MSKFTFNIKSVGLIAIGVILLAEYLIIPWFEWVDNTQLSIISQQNTLIKQEKLIERAQLLETQRDELATKFTDTLANLAIVAKGEDSAIVWLKEVETHLAKYDVEVNQKSPLREIQINDSFAVFAGRVNIKGNYSEILNIIGNFENYSVGNRVRQLRLNSNKATPHRVIADIEFIKVFKRS
ncbi:hypothetical protein GCM10009111_13170 [Colwellia asteriadis]|uniref:Uncharacterized protein n=1 Tax=Colwellia asteriadis TaxID=517723 RepID=A0ABN1L5N3_9GAMM